VSPDRAAIVRRPRARADLVEAVLWLRDNASPRVAVERVDTVEDALALLAEHPLAGSGHVGLRLGIPDLRSFPVSGTPYILYYLAGSPRIGMVRIFSGHPKP